MTIHPNLIAGEWTESSLIHRNINPSDVDDLVGEYAVTTSAQVMEAIDAAWLAFPAWASTTPQQRFEILDKAETWFSPGGRS